MSIRLDDPGSRITACGLREDQVNRIMEQRVVVWAAKKAQERFLFKLRPTSAARTRLYRERLRFRRTA